MLICIYIYIYSAHFVCVAASTCVWLFMFVRSRTGAACVCVWERMFNMYVLCACFCALCWWSRWSEAARQYLSSIWNHKTQVTTHGAFDAVFLHHIELSRVAVCTIHHRRIARGLIALKIFCTSLGGVKVVMTSNAFNWHIISVHLCLFCCASSLSIFLIFVSINEQEVSSMYLEGRPSSLLLSSSWLLVPLVWRSNSSTAESRLGRCFRAAFASAVDQRISVSFLRFAWKVSSSCRTFLPPAIDSICFCRCLFCRSIVAGTFRCCCHCTYSRRYCSHCSSAVGSWRCCCCHRFY